MLGENSQAEMRDGDLMSIRGNKSSDYNAIDAHLLPSKTGNDCQWVKLFNKGGSACLWIQNFFFFSRQHKLFKINFK